MRLNYYAVPKQSVRETVPLKIKQLSLVPLEFTAQAAENILQAKRKSRVKFVSDVVFYLAISFCIISAFMWRGGEGGSFLGYRVFNVETGSMQREIPIGSLVLVKRAVAADIAVGTDITFLRGDGKVATHRVVKILPSDAADGSPGYRTKGLENPMADRETVYLGNILGVVQKHVPKLGGTLMFAKEHLPILGALFGALLLLSFSLRLLFGADGALRKKGESRTEHLTHSHA
ncbi:MAG: signal peptidase I [Oscillospiraceae bacterium]|jgi:signal peptidase I|nr:signal peptidase I [Oscillospiraceae bacterium]